jgi:hypothetical protein
LSGAPRRRTFGFARFSAFIIALLTVEKTKKDVGRLKPAL